MYIKPNKNASKLSQRTYSENIMRIAYSTAACSYKIIPNEIVFPKNEIDIKDIFEYAKLISSNITFRGGGTSLSGQCLGDGIICNLSKEWTSYEVINNGDSIKCQPGIVAGRVNEVLKKYKRRIGPDPASINAATIGGILANNSSGMMSGINQSAYHSFQSMSFILSSGTQINSADADADENLKIKEPFIYHELQEIRKYIYSNEKILSKIKKSYELKNTIGYQMNAFVDFDKPIDILTHLLIGSEGTLGFISSVVLKTYPIYDFRITGLALFNNFSGAAKAIPHIKNLNPQSVEIIDINSLNSVGHLKELPEIIKKVNCDDTVLLFDFASDSEIDLNNFKNDFENISASFSNLKNFIFESNNVLQEKIWKIRKGLLPAIGKSRPSGTGVIIEDLCFKIEDFPNAINDLRILLKKFNYENVSIYGHGFDGNIHFLLNQSYGKYSEVKRFGNFMEKLAELVVVQYDASLKAEHSTGRNQAPFVEKVWGKEIYHLMKRIKKVLDPENILNQDVIISDDKQIHLKNLKDMPETDMLIDSCIECGFCEPVCPSRFATLTPRQRISVLRHFKNLDINSDEYINLSKEYQYYSINTCATDGMCELSCPVGINTGDLIKQFRNNSHSKSTIDVSLFFADKFNIIENVLNPANSTLHSLNKILPNKLVDDSFVYLSKNLQKIGIDIDQWNHNLGEKSSINYSNINNSKVDYIYFPTCITRMMGQDANDKTDLHQTVLNLAKKAKITVDIPDDFKYLCCGQAFASKGFDDAAKIAKLNLLETIYKVTNKGKIPLIMSASSCAYHIIKDESNYEPKYTDLKIIEITEWAYILLNYLKFIKSNKNIMLHINCSIDKLGLREKLIQIAKAAANYVYIPVHSTCCGSAGDRSLIYPEIIESSLYQVKKEIINLNITECYSSNSTCEFSIANSLKIKSKSILFLLDECSF